MSDGFFKIVLVLLLVFSLAPSLQLPYFMDEFDILRELNLASGTPRFFSYLIEPHNKHIQPIVKMLCYIFYKFFQLDNSVYHLIIWLFYFIFIIMLYGMLLKITGSELASSIGAAFFAFSNIYISSVLETVYSPVFLSVFFIFLFCFSIYKYCEKERKIWMALSFLSVLSAGFTVCFGLIALPLGIFYYVLCVPRGLKRGTMNAARVFMPGLSAFLIISFVYALSAWHQYAFNAALEINIMKLSAFVSKAIFRFLIPNILPNVVISLTLGCFIFLILIIYRKSVNRQAILFFICLVILNYAIAYAFRGKFGDNFVFYSRRYHILSSVSLISIYAVGLGSFIKENKYFHGKAAKNIIYIALIIIGIMGYNERVRYTEGFALSASGSFYFCRQFKDAVANYFKQNEKSKITLKNVNVKFPAHIYNMEKPLQFYGEFILPKEILSKIIWADETDKPFKLFLKEHKDEYVVFMGYLGLNESDEL